MPDWFGRVTAPFVPRLPSEERSLCLLASQREGLMHQHSNLNGQTPRIRVLVAKPGLDGHDRGAKVISRALRDAGMEVIYTGLRQTPEMVVCAALEEDVDVIGLSILSGAHNSIVPRIMELLKLNHADDILLLVGGIIPDDDFQDLKKAGVAAVFQPGTPTARIVEFIRANVKPRSVVLQ